MEMKIFRCGRGGGKTKWLFERAVEARDAGHNLLYVGGKGTMKSLSDMWMAELHELCPIKNISEWTRSSRSVENCFLTDNFLENIETVGFWKRVIDREDGAWYITMDKEFFVD